MNKFTRGEVVLVNLEPTIGHEQQGEYRPCLIVSSDDLNDIAPVAIVCPISKSKPGRLRRYGVVSIPANEGGLNFNSDILTIQIRTIDLSRVRSSIGQISSEQMARVELSLKMVLDLD